MARRSMREAVLTGSLQVCSLGFCLAALVLACSGKSSSRGVAEISAHRTSENVDTQNSSTTGPSIALVTKPANETTLSYLESQVEGQGVNGFRYALGESSDPASCKDWSGTRSLNDILVVDIASEGHKVLCLEGLLPGGGAGPTAHYAFTKIAQSDRGSLDFMLAGLPAAYTASSNATVHVNSDQAEDYRFSLAEGRPCSFMEASQWVNKNTPMGLSFTNDAAWALCVEVRDAAGNLKQKKFSWIRDTLYPVLDPLALPDEPTLTEQFMLVVSGSRVDFYQWALLNGAVACDGAVYSALTPVSEALTFSVPGDGPRTLCVMTENRDGLRQQAPWSKVINKVLLKANVSLSPVPVSSSLVPHSTSRSITIAGEGVTHYKSYTSDMSTTCDGRSPTQQAPVSVSQPLVVAFTYNGGIKTVCVWGYSIQGDSTTQQMSPTWFRFYNSTSYSTLGLSAAGTAPLTLRQAAMACSCHEYFSVSAWQENAQRISYQLRNNLMPKPTGYTGNAVGKAAMDAFVATIPGYPVDMPYVIQAATRTPTPTPTPSPTTTASPTPTPTPTMTASPTPTATATATPKPTATPIPVAFTLSEASAYCVSCHGSTNPSAGLDLTKSVTWRQNYTFIRASVVTNTMPPTPLSSYEKLRMIMFIDTLAPPK